MKTKIDYPLNLNDLETVEERQVIKALKYGQDNATSMKDMAKKTGIKKRTVFTILRKLKSNGYLIGSSRANKGGGVFLIETPDEYWHTVNYLKANAKSYTSQAYGILKSKERFLDAK